MANEKLMPAYSDYPESASPATPSSGHVRVYAKADGNMYQKDDAGTETSLAGGGSGAPTTATYITQTPDATLSAEQALSLLSTGLMKVTTTTGVVSSVAAPSGAVVGDTDSQTLTNKTISGASNTLSNVNLASQVTGTLPIANGGTNATTASAARTQLGLEIGTNVQAYDDDLQAIANLSTTGFIRRTGAGTADTVPAMVIKSYRLDLGSNQTTTSTSYGDVTNSSQSHTFTKANALIFATVTASNSGNNNTDVRIMVNGNAGADAIVGGVIGNTNATSPTWGERFTSIAGGSVTIKLQFKVSAGTGTLAARHPLIYTIIEYD